MGSAHLWNWLERHNLPGGMPFSYLKDYRNTIAVAGGKEKHTAIKAALNCDYIDVLITDDETARFLIGE